MDHSSVSLLIHRIGSGKFYFKHNSNSYVYMQPNSDIKYKSEILYNEYIENYKYDTLWMKDNIKNLLFLLSIWSDAKEQTLQDLEKKVDNLKLNMFLNKLNNEKVKSLRKELNHSRELINKLSSQKHSLDYLTLEDMANTVKNEYIMCECILQSDESTKVFMYDPKKVSYADFLDISTCVAQNFISIESYKIVARSDQWKAIWNSNKHNLFYNKSSYELSDEQKTLISITNMYDKIYEHPECPEDNVINDDDMLDGWMIYQRNKADKNKKQNSVNELNNKHKNAREIFVVGDADDVDNIRSLNSDESLFVMKQRKQAIKSSEDGVDDVFLPDVQRELLQKLNSRK